jgi:AAA15 family ATPase/GTPase
LYSTPDVIRESIRKQMPVIKNGRIVSLALIEEIDKILKSDKAKYYNEILKDILNIDNTDIVNIGQELKNLVFTFANKQKNTINELSDGTLIALNIITYLMSNKYPVIAIEELENSIHPKLLKKIIYLIKNDFSSIQIILTTHSPVLLNMVKVNEVSIISNREFGEALIEPVKNNKELIKKLSGPFSSFSDLFFYTGV